MKWYDFVVLGVFGGVVALLIMFSTMSTYAAEPDEPETGQEKIEVFEAPADIELDEPEDIQPEDTQEDTQTEPEPEQAEAVPVEQLEPVESDSQYYITGNDYEYETLKTLKSIEYNLKIVSGGVIITALGFFLWLTVYLPMKKFMSV